MTLLIRRHGPDSASLTIAGDGAPRYIERLKAQARELVRQGCVEFIGRVAPDKMPALYDDMDIMVFPSVWAEPLSIARLEAMARGIPLISTETGGGSEVVRDGQNALVVPPRDPEAIADALSRLMDDPDLMQRLSDGAVDTIEERFVFEDIILRIEEYLHHAAKHAARPASAARAG